MGDLPDMLDMKSLVGLPASATAENMMDLIDTNGDHRLNMDEFTDGLVRLSTSDTHQLVIGLTASVNRLLQAAHRDHRAPHTDSPVVSEAELPDLKISHRQPSG